MLFLFPEQKVDKAVFQQYNFSTFVCLFLLQPLERSIFPSFFHLYTIQLVKPASITTRCYSPGLTQDIFYTVSCPDVETSCFFSSSSKLPPHRTITQFGFLATPEKNRTAAQILSLNLLEPLSAIIYTVKSRNRR